MRLRPTKYLKVITWCVLLAFSGQQAAWAAPTAGISPSLNRISHSLEDVIQDPSKLYIPSEHATLKEIYKAPLTAHRSPLTAKLIILIEDAHANLSGQKNIAATLDDLMKEYDIPIVLVEGGDRDVTLDEVKKIADKKTWGIVANKLLNQGIVTGAEYLNLTSDYPMKLMGIEYTDLYEANLQAYADLAGKRKESLLYLHRIQISLDRLKNRLYPREIIDYEAAKQRSSEEAGGFTENFDRLLELVKKAPLDIENDFPEVARLKALRAEEAATLNEFTRLNFTRLFAELESLEDQIYRYLLTDEDTKKIRALDRYLGLLNKAYRIQMSSHEFRMLEVNEAVFATPKWQSFMNEKLKQLDYKDGLISYEPHLEEAREELKRFYSVVGQRDEAFLKNTGRILEEQSQNVAFMITGGYHTENLTRLLREEGYSYLVLTPLVTHETDMDIYEDVLLAPLKLARKEQANLKEALSAVGKAMLLSSDGQAIVELAEKDIEPYLAPAEFKAALAGARRSRKSNSPRRMTGAGHETRAHLARGLFTTVFDAGDYMEKVVNDKIADVLPISYEDRVRLADNTLWAIEELRKKNYPVPETWRIDPVTLGQKKSQGYAYEALGSPRDMSSIGIMRTADEAMRSLIDAAKQEFADEFLTRNVVIDASQNNFRFTERGEVQGWFDPVIPDTELFRQARELSGSRSRPVRIQRDPDESRSAGASSRRGTPQATAPRGEEQIVGSRAFSRMNAAQFVNFVKDLNGRVWRFSWKGTLLSDWFQENSLKHKNIDLVVASEAVDSDTFVLRVAAPSSRDGDARIRSYRFSVQEIDDIKQLLGGLKKVGQSMQKATPSKWVSSQWADMAAYAAFGFVLGLPIFLIFYLSDGNLSENDFRMHILIIEMAASFLMGQILAAFSYLVYPDFYQSMVSAESVDSAEVLLNISRLEEAISHKRIKPEAPDNYTKSSRFGTFVAAIVDLYVGDRTPQEKAQIIDQLAHPERMPLLPQEGEPSEVQKMRLLDTDTQAKFAQFIRAWEKERMGIRSRWLVDAKSRGKNVVADLLEPRLKTRLESWEAREARARLESTVKLVEPYPGIIVLVVEDNLYEKLFPSSDACHEYTCYNSAPTFISIKLSVFEQQTKSKSDLRHEFYHMAYPLLARTFRFPDSRVDRSFGHFRGEVASYALGGWSLITPSAAAFEYEPEDLRDSSQLMKALLEEIDQARYLAHVSMKAARDDLYVIYAALHATDFYMFERMIVNTAPEMTPDIIERLFKIWNLADYDDKEENRKIRAAVFNFIRIKSVEDPQELIQAYANDYMAPNFGDNLNSWHKYRWSERSKFLNETVIFTLGHRTTDLRLISKFDLLRQRFPDDIPDEALREIISGADRGYYDRAAVSLMPPDLTSAEAFIEHLLGEGDAGQAIIDGMLQASQELKPIHRRVKNRMGSRTGSRRGAPANRIQKDGTLSIANNLGLAGLDWEKVADLPADLRTEALPQARLVEMEMTMPTPGISPDLLARKLEPLIEGIIQGSKRYDIKLFVSSAAQENIPDLQVAATRVSRQMAEITQQKVVLTIVLLKAMEELATQERVESDERTNRAQYVVADQKDVEAILAGQLAMAWVLQRGILAGQTGPMDLDLFALVALELAASENVRQTGRESLVVRQAYGRPLPGDVAEEVSEVTGKRFNLIRQYLAPIARILDLGRQVMSRLMVEVAA